MNSQIPERRLEASMRGNITFNLFLISKRVVTMDENLVYFYNPEIKL